MRVYIGSDHAGFELKSALISHLGNGGFDVVDIGPASYQPGDDYPAYCLETARRVVADHGSLGIVIGGSGNGEQIAANKVTGIRAALVWNLQTAQLSAPRSSGTCRRRNSPASTTTRTSSPWAPGCTTRPPRCPLSTPFWPPRSRTTRGTSGGSIKWRLMRQIRSRRPCPKAEQEQAVSRPLSGRHGERGESGRPSAAGWTRRPIRQELPCCWPLG